MYLRRREEMDKSTLRNLCRTKGDRKYWIDYNLIVYLQNKPNFSFSH